MTKWTLRGLALLTLLILSAVVFAADRAAPSKPTLTSPTNGEISTTHSPLLQWTYNSNETVDSFKVIVKNALNQRVYKKVVTPVDVCDGDSCFASPGAEEISFANELHTWFVIARNADGRAKSDKFTFTINFPGSPVLIAPVDGADVPIMPTFTWEPVAQAEQYRIKVRGTGSTTTKYTSDWLDGATVCSGNACSHGMTTELTLGTYKWFVEARQTTFNNVSKSVKNTMTVVNVAR